MTTTEETTTTTNILTESEKEELRKRVEYMAENTNHNYLFTEPTPKEEKEKEGKPMHHYYGWLKNPMSPKHKKRILKQAMKKHIKIDKERIGKNYVI